MTRARHVTPGRTAERMEKIRKLITALQEEGYLMRDEIGPMLGLGPSGVRKYLADLRDQVEVSEDRGHITVRLTMSSSQTEAFLKRLAATAPARPTGVAKTPERITAAEPGRHFHILADDTHHAIRIHRGPVVRDWAVAALFGAGPARMEVRA